MASQATPQTLRWASKTHWWVDTTQSTCVRVYQQPLARQERSGSENCVISLRQGRDSARAPRDIFTPSCRDTPLRLLSAFSQESITKPCPHRKLTMGSGAQTATPLRVELDTQRPRQRFSCKMTAIPFTLQCDKA